MSLVDQAHAAAQRGELGEAVRLLRLRLADGGAESMGVTPKERSHVCMHIAELSIAMSNWSHAIEWSVEAFLTDPKWARPYAVLGKAYYFVAQSAVAQGLPRERDEWRRCVHWFELALSIPKNELLFEVAPFLNVAYAKLGQFEDACRVCKEALSIKHDEGLVHNLRSHEEALTMEGLTHALGRLKELGKVTEEQRTAILEEVKTGRPRVNQGQDLSQLYQSMVGLQNPNAQAQAYQGQGPSLNR